MDVGLLFAGIVCLVIAWALWTYLPAPLGVIGGLIFGLLGIYCLFLGVIGAVDDGHHNAHAVVTVARSSWGLSV